MKSLIHVSVVVLVLALICGESVMACSIPVFRYALERWPSDLYSAFVLHPGPLPSAYSNAIQALDLYSQKNSINLSIQIIDTSKTLDKDIAFLKPELEKAQSGHPILVVRYPDRFGLNKPIYSGPITAELLNRMLQSPAREELTSKLSSGDTAVWIILDNGDPNGADALEKRITPELRRLENELKLPSIDPNDKTSRINYPVPIKIAFSILRIKQSDPNEQFLVEMLKRSTSLTETVDSHEALLIPVFGQGRLIEIWKATEFQPSLVNDIGKFLCGPCMCQYKEQNPGVDLLLLADWNNLLLGNRNANAPIPNFESLLKEVPLQRETDVPSTGVIEKFQTQVISVKTVAGVLLALLGATLLLLKFKWQIRTLAGSGLIMFGAVLLIPIRDHTNLPMQNHIPSSDASATKSIMLYCAAGLREPIERVRKEYEKQYGVEVQIQYGGSGTLFSNLNISRKGDLFLSADSTLMTKAHKSGLVREVFTLATQRPVVITTKGNPHGIQKLSHVTQSGIKWCFGNPDATAVGTTTKRVLQRQGMWDFASAQATVFKPTVNDVANDVELGSADAGIVWDCTALAYPDLEVIHLPELDTKEEEIELGVLNFSEHPLQSVHFARFLSAADRGLVFFKQNGYVVSDGDDWSENPELIVYSGALNRLSLQPVIDIFEKREGVSVKAIYNGCGILTAQMKIDMGKKSFPDLYFACDGAFFDPVQKWFLPAQIVSETDIVLLVAKGNPKNIQTVQDLNRPGLKLGIGNCQQCTLGLLTKRFLTAAEGLYEQISPNIRSEQPTADILINQMQTGSLDAIIVYKVNAEQVKDKLDAIPINEKGALAVQPIAVSKASKHKYMARRFIDQLLLPDSRIHIENLGFRWRAGETAL